MRKVYRFRLSIAIMFAMFVSTTSIAQEHVINMNGGPLKEENWMSNPAEAPLNEDHSDNKNWITRWYGPDGNYENNGGAEVSAPKDLIKEGTWDLLTQGDLSTLEGLQLTELAELWWADDNGGTREWTVFELDVDDPHNMNRDGPSNNMDIYALVVIDAPKDMKAVMSPAHDDHAQIWINGEKWYNNALGTREVKQVDYNIEVELQRGINVLVYRCSQSDVHAYMNLHFDDHTHEVCDIYPKKWTRTQAEFLLSWVRV